MTASVQLRRCSVICFSALGFRKFREELGVYFPRYFLEGDRKGRSRNNLNHLRLLVVKCNKFRKKVFSRGRGTLGKNSAFCDPKKWYFLPLVFVDLNFASLCSMLSLMCTTSPPTLRCRFKPKKVFVISPPLEQEYPAIRAISFSSLRVETTAR